MKKYITLENNIYEATLILSTEKTNDEFVPINRKTGVGGDKNHFFVATSVYSDFEKFFPKILKDKKENKSNRNNVRIKNYFSISNILNDLYFINNEIERNYKDEASIDTKDFSETIFLMAEEQNLKTNFYIESDLGSAGNGIGFKNWDNSYSNTIKLLLLHTTKTKVYLFKKENDICSYFEFNQHYLAQNTESKLDLMNESESVNLDLQNVIYYGSPGTGKSHKADEITNGKDVQKVTFHPDYDYHSFVGGYKPTMDGDKIAYKFVPQIFTKIYVKAWKNFSSAYDTKPFYLQIEEINRGNCAEIFGDLFQLLDRKSDGSSNYEVTAEEELFKYLLSADGFGEEHNGIKDGKLRFPSNLKIIATMNTSDQSLFPMDSAFKRRWDWIYVPIDINCKFSDFTIKLDNGKAFKWLSFLIIINEEIFEITKSQDKQIGNWFIDAQNTGKVISESTFVNKVIFYLWNDVFKDEENTIFKSADGKNITYTSFFENGTSTNLVSYILEERLNLTDFNKAETNTNELE
jgi:hypothetical protein